MVSAGHDVRIARGRSGRNRASPQAHVASVASILCPRMTVKNDTTPADDGNVVQEGTDAPSEEKKPPVSPSCSTKKKNSASFSPFQNIFLKNKSPHPHISASKCKHEASKRSTLALSLRRYTPFRHPDPIQRYRPSLPTNIHP